MACVSVGATRKTTSRVRLEKIVAGLLWLPESFRSTVRQKSYRAVSHNLFGQQRCKRNLPSDGEYFNGNTPRVFVKLRPPIRQFSFLLIQQTARETVWSASPLFRMAANPALHNCTSAPQTLRDGDRIRKNSRSSTHAKIHISNVVIDGNAAIAACFRLHERQRDGKQRRRKYGQRGHGAQEEGAER